MTDNVKSLFGGVLPTRAPREDVVEAARELLAACEAGEVISFAVAQTYFDGQSAYRIAGKDIGYSMIGALEMAKSGIVEGFRDA